VDNLCHTLVGAACGEAGLKRRTALGSATLMIAANLPDIDVLVFATDVPSVAFRRGWTHGVLAQALLPVALAVVMLLIGRLLSAMRAQPQIVPSLAGNEGLSHNSAAFHPEVIQRRRCDLGALLLLSYVGVLSHVALDWLNNYGVRLLMPFSGRWFYGDAVFILDPWLWLILGIGVWWSCQRNMTGAARWALVAATIYIGGMVISARAARSFVLGEWRAVHGTDPLALMVGPVAITPFRRTVILDAGDRYVTGTFKWFPPRVTFDPEDVPKRDQDPAARAARAQDPRVRAVLVWARFPYFLIESTAHGTLVSLRDLRFGNRVGGVETTVSKE
jgi:inner membrane protein